MAASSPADPPIGPSSNPNSTSDIDQLQIPLYPVFFSEETDPNLFGPFNSDDFDLGLCFEETGDCEFNFSELDDLYLPPETEAFLIPDSDQPPVELIGSESGSSGISADHAQDVAAYLNCSPSGSGVDGSSGNQKLDVDEALNFPSSDISGGPVSSQGSGNGGGESGGSEDTNAPSPGCDNFADRDVSSKLVDEKVKSEDSRNTSVSKRKKELEDPISKDEYRSKYRRSSICTDKADTQWTVDASSEEDDKRKARLMRNRESAQLSRQRKKHYVEELEDKVRNMHSTIADLNNKISYIMTENLTLRQQLGGGGMCPPPPGMYPQPPMGHMPYPWMPCAPYVVKPQGSHVRLVPIPRLKPQQPISASKSKKAEGKKNEGKTKKVASVTFLGLMFFVFLFGGLVPMLNVKFGGVGDLAPGGMGYFNNGPYDHRGRVLAVSGHTNGSYHNTRRGQISERMNRDRGRSPKGGNGESLHSGNGSKPLAAFLYVPRNDKLVKIEGNLILHSVIASERAKASQLASEVKNDRGSDLAMLRNLASALVIPEAHRRVPHSYVPGNPTDRPRALASGTDDPLKDHIRKSVSANGRLQEWFREGLVGPILNSGTCTEVFQFDVSPTPGAIIPASSVTNITSERAQNNTEATKGRNRRTLRGLPFPIPGPHFNETETEKNPNPNPNPNPSSGNLPSNKSLSSMVVSVLVDPREASDTDIDGVIRPKSLSRIFVVVLLDSIKYVTYSCALPRSAPHLVTT